MDPAKEFAELVALPDEQIDLARACLLIARHAHSDLDVAAHLRRLDAIAVRSPSTLEGMIDYLFRDLGFHGNVEEYDDPANSLLDEVIDRRTGLPITLSIVTMEVGARVGLPIVGIGMPAHFLVRHEHEPRVYIDPFYGGEILDEQGCRARLAELLGKEVPFDRAWLRATPRRDILARVLGNLKSAYAARTQWRNVEWVCRTRLAIPGAPATEAAELGRAIAAQGRYVEAAEEIARAAVAATDDAERRALEGEAITLRARLN